MPKKNTAQTGWLIAATEGNTIQLSIFFLNGVTRFRNSNRPWFGPLSFLW